MLRDLEALKQRAHKKAIKEIVEVLSHFRDDEWSREFIAEEIMIAIDECDYCFVPEEC